MFTPPNGDRERCCQSARAEVGGETLNNVVNSCDTLDAGLLAVCERGHSGAISHPVPCPSDPVTRHAAGH